LSAIELELASDVRRRFVVTHEHRLGAGKQGRVYTVQFDPTLAVKLYYLPEQQDAQRLEAMRLIATPQDFEIRPAGASASHQQLAWPHELVCAPDSGEIVGYTMPRYAKHEYRQLDALWDPRGRAEDVPGTSWLFLLTVARNLATLAAMVHERGLVLGDVRDANFVFSTRTALVALLDCDSMPITDPRTDTHFPCLLSHPDYAPPELQPGERLVDPRRRRTEHTDNFSLAVLICRLLLAGDHPFTGWPAAPVDEDDEVSVGQNIRAGRSYLVAPEELRLASHVIRPDVIPAPVLELARKAFSAGLREPVERPSSAEWRAALSAALKEVADCSLYPERHKYSGDLWSCPWCEAPYDPFPPEPEPEPNPEPGAISALLVVVVLVLIAVAIAGAAVALLLS
jgi:DNA-binding helix-hairpin-helix protein with protein kinase domain